MGGATPTDFRQSSLRIHLDADRSSGHMTGGYYDTLTTCRKEAPVADDDIELFTCGAEVDYISFRLGYYDQPRLAAEYLTAEANDGNFRQTADSRWVWENSYGADEDQIKDFLRSVRYHADWDPMDADQSRERVVKVTMHVGEDSTTSWTVYQLEADEVYAGRDTTVEYCSEGVPLDLRSYLSPGVDINAGYFSPEPSGGGSIFITDTDPDGEYLYIIEKEDCADTAVITMQEAGRSWPRQDTVWLCPGESKQIGLPPGKFTYVEWWDGSRSDSIWVDGSLAGEYLQITVGFEDCHIVSPLEVALRPSAHPAGEDLTIPYCADGSPFSLTDFLPAAAGYTARPEPAMSSGDLIFSPGTDPPGIYRYILTPEDPEAGCPDTAIITLEASAAGEILLEPVRLCNGESVKTGLPQGSYQNIRWWNGGTGDSTLVTGDDAGTLWVEAERDGCTYHGDFTAEVLPDPAFPDHFPDRLTLCTGEESRLIVADLDSILWAGRTYLPGEEILFTEAGNHLLTGYRDGYSVEKTIATERLPDPSAAYSEMLHFCEGESILLTLPEDTPELAFAWKDGTAGRERIVKTAGEYWFEITSADCTYEGSYTLLLQAREDCDPAPGSSCTVSLPNAVSPNGDGINDDLEIFFSSECGSLRSVSLFDQWGGMLYSTQETKIGQEVWNELPPGVYLVQVVYEDERGREKKEVEAVLRL